MRPSPFRSRTIVNSRLERYVRSFVSPAFRGRTSKWSRRGECDSSPVPERPLSIRATRAATAAGQRPFERVRHEAVWSVCGTWPLADGEPPDYVPDDIHQHPAIALAEELVERRDGVPLRSVSTILSMGGVSFLPASNRAFR